MTTDPGTPPIMKIHDSDEPRVVSRPCMGVGPAGSAVTGVRSTPAADPEGAYEMFDLMTARHKAILLAVSQGRAKVAASGHPDLTIDGRWCDHAATADLLRAGLLRPARLARVDELVPAK